ncbi:Hypothetical protein A7982_02493 [Minicystis rosea]|nr:Hypothetical protein A7982_02493 [Minicystis rosea]
MGVHVILDIVPQRIDPAAWAEVWSDVRALLSAHHAPLLGYDWSTAAGVPLPVYTRSIERDADDPVAHRLSIAGERATLAVGAQQTIHRDLGRYIGRCPTLATAPDDILLSAAGVAPDDATNGPVSRRGSASEPPASLRALPAFPVPTAPERRSPAGHVHEGIIQVLGEAPCPAPCVLPLLGAAMLVEARFPRHALVHGDIDHDLADAARRWAERVLGRAVALPVRVDAWRLVERLGVKLSGQALLRAVERLHLAPPAKRDAALLSLFERNEAEPFWLGRLAATARTGGAREVVAAYLDATHDLTRLCGLACLDGRGPRLPPDALVELLASLRPEPDAKALGEALKIVFGAGAPRLASSYREKIEARAAAPPESNGVPRAHGAAPDPDHLDRLPTLASPADLGPAQREHVHAVAWLARMLLGRIEARSEATERPALHRTIAALLARGGPTLTEDAWEWILREDDVAVLRFLVALAALDPRTSAVSHVRRALFENRALCRYAAAASRDEPLMAATAARAGS